jgi:vitamin B12 transporter
LRIPCHLIVFLFTLLFSLSTAWGADPAEELLLLGLDSVEIKEARPAITPRPISRIAENVSIVTADQIALLNAHSLAEVLQTVPGILVENTRTPGSWTGLKIQGESDADGYILLMIDGISQGNLIQGVIDPGLIAVQHIERIEIIKGSASAAWGPALGGVINVITKSPENGRPISGSAAASLGERNTTNLAADLSGASHNIGYYLSGGNLYSKGLLPNNGVNRNNLYGKLTYDLPKGNLTVGGSYIEAKRGILDVYAFDSDPPYTEIDNNKDYRYYSFINFTYQLQPDLSLELSAQDSRLGNQTIWGHLDGSQVVADNHFVLKEKTSGAKVKLSWGDKLRNLVTGIDFLHTSVTDIDKLDPSSGFFVDKRRDSLAFYANGAISFGQLTLLPGIRYDHTGLDENALNYTMGGTYRLSDKTLLRGYWARGFAMPNALLQSVPTKIWTLQAGIESEAVPYLWLKGTYFYNHIWRIQEFTDAAPIFHKRNRQGVELEVRTTPIAGFSLSSGYTYTDARDDNDKRIKNVPVSLLKIALNYNNPSSGTKGILTGNYTDLNMEAWHLAHYRPVIWNLSLTQQLFPGKDVTPEIFLNINNILNGSQYWDYWYKNTNRWVEGGVRFKF